MAKTSPVFSAKLRTLFDAALALLFPPSCVGCQAAGTPLCPACAQQVQPVDAPCCPRCGRQQARAGRLCMLCEQDPTAPLRMIRGAALHTAPMRQAIHALKYEDRRELAAPLAHYLVAAFQSPEWHAGAVQIDAVVPIPLHAARLAARGYNQAQLLAEAFCQRTGLACQPSWIERHQFTRPQVGLNADERRANVAAAFAARPTVRGQTLLLIDDVYTTGATLRACAAAARTEGARAVYGLALAQPPRARPCPEDDVTSVS